MRPWPWSEPFDASTFGQGLSDLFETNVSDKFEGAIVPFVTPSIGSGVIVVLVPLRNCILPD
jgi:hypothetical protein